MTCIKVFSCFENTYTYCIKCETFRSALLPEIYLPSGMKAKITPDLSLVWDEPW